MKKITEQIKKNVKINMDTGPSEMRPIFIGITLLGPVPMLIIISKDFL